MDEKSFQKGHEYVTVICDLRKPARVLAVGDGRGRASLDEFYKGLKEDQRSGIQGIAMDMWGPYISSTQRRHVRRLWRNVLDLVGRQLRRLSRSAAIAASTKTTILGVEVINIGEPDEDGHVFLSIQEAIRLVASVDSRTFKRLKRTVRIAVLPHPGSSYWSEMRVIAPSRLTLEEQRVEWTASVIVHELCHARLHDRGFHYRGDMKARLEKICIGRQQLALPT